MSDLESFIARYATPYDEATDAYERTPFAQPVKAGKNSPIYNAHSYHTKVPPEGIVPYIEHYTSPGDLVLDPFCGSGMTGVAALMADRRVILNDISPAAVHIARNFCTPVDIDAVKAEFARIKVAVQEEFDWLYGTTCDRCGNAAVIIYMVWSDVFQCERCSESIVLWDVGIDRQSGKVSSLFQCPHCGKEQRKRPGMIRLSPVPVLTSYECHSCNPRRLERTTKESEKQRISEINAREIPYWIPDTSFDLNGPRYRRDALSGRGITKVVDLFTKRNLRMFASIFHEIKKVRDDRVREVLLFAFTGVVDKANNRNKWIPGKTSYPFPIQSGSIYIPSLIKEYSAWKAFSDKLVLRVIPILRGLSFPENNAYVSVNSATNLKNIPSNLLDYIFTDPPFGSSIYYSELNLLWEAWLGQITDPTMEAVVHRVQDGGNKRLSDYALLMTNAFSEMYRVLKPGRWASIVFHNSDDQIWQSILQASESAGFELAEINTFDKVQLTFMGLKGEAGEYPVTNKDIVLNLKKPAPRRLTSSNPQAPRAEVEERVIAQVADFLASGPEPDKRTLQYLWNHVLVEMLRSGSVQLSMTDVGRVLESHYGALKLVDGRYYLRTETILGNNVFDLRSDTGAITWLQNILSREPQTTGDLIPIWQKETAQLGGFEPGRLERLLEQNFIQDRRSGRWRLLRPDEQDTVRTREDLKAEAHLRVVHQFLEGNLERRPSDVELAAWIRFCYTREHFSEAARLFERINQADVSAEEYNAVKRMATVSRLRAASETGNG